MEIAWHLNGKFLPTDNRISTQQFQTNRSLTGMLRFKRMKSAENGAMFTCLAWYPTLQDVHASSTSVITVMGKLVNIFIYFNLRLHLYIRR